MNLLLTHKNKKSPRAKQAILFRKVTIMFLISNVETLNFGYFCREKSFNRKNYESKICSGYLDCLLCGGNIV